MSSDEDDYMSEKWLENISDVRPGLTKSHAKLRENALSKKKVQHSQDQKKKSKNLDYKERLSEGLISSIQENNKGFALLQKMGYKKGDGIGKSSNGILEPIGITVKDGRSGLGLESRRKEQMKQREEFRNKILKRKRSEHESTEVDFKKRILERVETQKSERNLRNCQKTCKTLDETNDVLEPTFKWCWPDVPKVTADDESDDSDDQHEEEDEIEEYTCIEKFEFINKYLRGNYYYCFWCGAKYDDEQDMLSNCPGESEDDH